MQQIMSHSRGNGRTWEPRRIRRHLIINSRQGIKTICEHKLTVKTATTRCASFRLPSRSVRNAHAHIPRTCVAGAFEKGHSAFRGLLLGMIAGGERVAHLLGAAQADMRDTFQGREAHVVSHPHTYKQPYTYSYNVRINQSVRQ